MSKSNAFLFATGAGAILARRYARALFELAGERKQIETVGEEFRELREVLMDESLRDLIHHQARLSGPDQRVAMEKFADAVKFCDVTRRFLALMGQNRRLKYLGATVEAFLEILAKKAGAFAADVISAKPLTEAQEAALEAALSKRLGGKVYLRASIDQSLLGGLVVRIGSRQVDASVKGRLATLERQLKSQQEAA